MKLIPLFFDSRIGEVDSSALWPCDLFWLKNMQKFEMCLCDWILCSWVAFVVMKRTHTAPCLVKLFFDLLFKWDMELILSFNLGSRPDSSTWDRPQQWPTNPQERKKMFPIHWHWAYSCVIVATEKYFIRFGRLNCILLKSIVETLTLKVSTFEGRAFQGLR